MFTLTQSISHVLVMILSLLDYNINSHLYIYIYISRSYLESGLAGQYRV
jgi:hypothetical protein